MSQEKEMICSVCKRPFEVDEMITRRSDGSPMYLDCDDRDELNRNLKRILGRQVFRRLLRAI